ncbi:hypothetical protein M0R45_038171 [Rubus argutus]|uniref:Uncharacterized protein n=1 Tax=Rubus argutus TaxID=59490 RepID=A0AAW1W4X2_RUBAR
MGVQLSAGLPLFNSTPIVEEGPFMGFAGACIDFQNHLEAQAVSVEHNHLVGIKPNPIPPTVTDSVMFGQPQKKSKGVQKKGSAKGQSSTTKSPSPPYAEPVISKVLAITGAHVTTSPLLTEVPFDNQTNNVLFLDGETSLLYGRLKDDLMADSATTSLGDRLKTESPPILTRSASTFAGEQQSGKATLLLVPGAGENIVNAKQSSGHTPNCPSVMGPVLTHHEP